MSKPYISVVIPAHNLGHKGDYAIKISLNSLKEQTFSNYEILIIENGSDDDTLQIAKSYAENDRRIKIHQLDIRGVSNARNERIKHALGEFIFFLDGDDSISPDFLESGYNILNQDPNIAYVLMPISFYYHKTNKYHEILIFNDEISDINDKFLSRSICHRIIRTNILTSNNIFFNTTLTHGEDLIFSYELFFVSKKAASSSKGTYLYHQNRHGQATKNLHNALSREIAPINILKNIFMKYNVIQHKIPYINSLYVQLITGSSFASTLINKMSMSSLYKELNDNTNKDILLSIDVINNPILNDWQKKWFKKFQDKLRVNIFKAVCLLKFMRIYKNVFIRMLKMEP